MNIRVATIDDVNQLERLYAILSAGYRPNEAVIELALSHPATEIFVAVEGEETAGTATVSFRAVPSKGLVAYIDDVVVDPRFQGRGLGRQLTERCVAAAREHGCCRIELTTRPTRVEANRLYEKCGFEKRDTNVFVLKLDK